MTPCTGPDADLWTSEDAEDRRIAAGMCGPCPLIESCREGAMERQERFCVFGGVDFSWTSSKPGFMCGASHDCSRKVAGYGWRGKQKAVVPTCDMHSFDAPVTVLEPVPRPVPDGERTLGVAV